MERKAGKLVIKRQVVQGFTIYEGVLGMWVNTYGASNKDTINYARAFFLKANQWSMSLLKSNNISSALIILTRCQQLLSCGWLRRFPLYQHLTSNNLACCFKKQNKLRTAQRYLQKALKVAKQFPQEVESPSLTHLNLCVIHHQLKQSRAAMEHAQQSVDGFEEEIENLKEQIKLFEVQKNFNSQKLYIEQSPMKNIIPHQGDVFDSDSKINKQMLSDSELSQLHRGTGAINIQQEHKKKLEKDIKQKQTLLAIGCYNLAVQHQHQHNWPECFSFYQKAIKKCSQSLGNDSKLVLDFNQAYERARKHRMNRGGGGIGTSLPREGNNSPSIQRDITLGISNISVEQKSKIKKGTFNSADYLETLINKNEQNPRRFLKNDTYDDGSQKSPSRITNNNVKEYYSFNSPKRKQRIMSHYLNAVKIKSSLHKPSSSLRQRSTELMSRTGSQKSLRSTFTNNFKKGPGMMSDKWKFKRQKRDGFFSDDGGQQNLRRFHTKFSSDEGATRNPSEGDQEFQQLDQEGRYNWGSPQQSRKQSYNLVRKNQGDISAIKSNKQFDHPVRVGGGYASSKRNLIEMNPGIYTSKIQQRIKEQSYQEKKPKSKKQLVIAAYKKQEFNKRKSNDKRSKSSGYNTPAISNINNFVKKSGVAFNQKQRKAISCIQRIFRGFLTRKKQSQKFIIYTCMYHQKSENSQDSQSLILKIRVNRKDEENPLIEFLVYCEGSPRKIMQQKRKQFESKRKFIEDFSSGQENDEDLELQNNLIKTFQISHPIGQTAFKDCKNQYECAALSKQFVETLKGDMLNDFRKIRIQNSKEILEEYRRKKSQEEKDQQLKPVEEVKNQDQQVSPNYIKNKKPKIHIAPADKLLYNDERELYIQGRTPVNVRVFIEEAGQNRVSIRGKLMMNGTSIPVQGTTRGKIMNFNMQQEGLDLKKKRKKVKQELIPNIVARRVKGKGIGLYFFKEQSESQKSSVLKQKKSSIDSQRSVKRIQLPNKGLAYNSKFPPKKPPTPKIKKSSSRNFDKQSSLTSKSSISTVRQDNITIKKPKLLQKEAFTITVKSKKPQNEKEMHFQVEAYNANRRKNYFLKDIPIESEKTKKTQGQIAQIIYEKLQFNVPSKSNKEGQINFDTEKHIYQQIKPKTPPFKIIQPDVFQIEEEVQKKEQAIINQYSQDIFDQQESEKIQKSKIDKSETIKSSSSRKSSISRKSSSRKSSPRKISERKSSIKSQFERRSSVRSQFSEESEMKRSNKSSVDQKIESPRKKQESQSQKQIEDNVQSVTLKLEDVNKQNLDESLVHDQIVSSNKKADTSSPSSLSSSSKSSLKSLKRSSQRSDQKKKEEEQEYNQSIQKIQSEKSKRSEEKQISQNEQQPYKEDVFQEQIEELNKFKENLLTKVEYKQEGIKIYIYKPNPDFEFKAIQNEKKEIAKTSASPFEIQDIFGQGIDEQNDDQIIAMMQENVSQYAKIQMETGQIRFIRPDFKDTSKNPIDQDELSGSQKAKKMIDDLEPEDLSNFGINLFKYIFVREKSVENSEKISKECEARYKKGIVFSDYLFQLKNMRQERPPLITKGSVRLSDRYFRFSVYGESHQNGEKSQIEEVEFDFYNANTKKMDTVAKKVSTDQMHQYTEKKNGYFDLSYLIHLFVKKVAMHGEWLQLPSFGDIIDSALSQR